LINIRSESILEKPTFKTGLARRRCLIPANGFYEWRKGDKAPFFIHPAEGDLLYMAAIYDSWTAPDGSYIPSCGIITTAANTDISGLHDRMPVILTSSSFDAWLNPQNSDPKILSSLLNPLPDGLLKLRPVSKYVNSIRNNDERCWQEDIPAESIF
jgi:putative SOS response-associated peptidase YedK